MNTQTLLLLVVVVINSQAPADVSLEVRITEDVFGGQSGKHPPPFLPLLCPDLQGGREALSSCVPSDGTPRANLLPHPLLQNKLRNIPNNPK